jgi:hypothetical protein
VINLVMQTPCGIVKTLTKLSGKTLQAPAKTPHPPVIAGMYTTNKRASAALTACYE